MSRCVLVQKIQSRMDLLYSAILVRPLEKNQKCSLKKYDSKSRQKSFQILKLNQMCQWLKNQRSKKMLCPSQSRKSSHMQSQKSIDPKTTQRPPVEKKIPLQEEIMRMFNILIKTLPYCHERL